MKIIKMIFFTFVFAYVLYLMAIPAFLNTSLLQRAAGITDETETHFKFHGAWSLFPGHIHARELIVAIRDHNVKVDVRAKNVTGTVSLLPFLKKEVWIHNLKTGKTQVYAELKGEEDSAIHHALHSVPKDQLEIASSELKKIEKKVWKIMVPKLEGNVDRVEIKQKVFTGFMHVSGGFYFQPGVVAEILPTQVQVKNGEIKDQLQNLFVDGSIQFKPFSIPDTGGSEVFDYLNASVVATGRATNLDLLNFILRSLPDYKFRSGKGNINAELLVNDGLIHEKSHIEVDRSEINFKTPSFELTGQGIVAWKPIPKTDTSQLTSTLFSPKAMVKIGKTGKATGQAHKISGKAKLYGLRFKNAFHGLHGLITIQNAKLKAEDTNKNSTQWSVQTTVSGEVAAVSGEAPPYPGHHKIEVNIDKSKLLLKSPVLQLEPYGHVSVSSKAVDFRAGQVEFGSANATLNLLNSDGESTQVLIESTKTEKLLSRSMGGSGRWRGEATVKIQGFDNLVETLKEPLKIPSIASTFLATNTVTGTFEWESSEDITFLRANSMESSGIWSAWGTYSVPAEGPSIAALEARILGLVPIGITLPGGPRVFPSSNWYNQLYRSSEVRLHQRSPGVRQNLNHF